METYCKTNWKQELKALKHEHIKRTTPGFFVASGGYDIKLNSWDDPSANGLTRCVIDWINFNGGYANRQLPWPGAKRAC